MSEASWIPPFAVAASAVVVAGLATVVMTPASTPHPRVDNVVVVVIDTLRADSLGLYGNDRASSPHLDAIAGDAIVYDKAWAAGTYTVPSFTSYMSSTHVRTHGWDFRGKGHAPRKRALCGQDDLVMLAEALRDDGVSTTAWVGNKLLHVKRGFPRGFDVWNGWSVTDMQQTAYTSKQGMPGFSDDAIVGEALAAVQSWSGGRNFLYVHLMRPHIPQNPGSEARTRYGLPKQRNLKQTDVDRMMKRGKASPVRERQTRDFYAASVWEADELLAPLFAEVDRPDTALLVFSDHGEELWERGRYGHEGGTWEQLAHVPLVVKVPGQASRRVDRPVSLVDVAPTVAGLLGVAAPPSWQGRSLFSTGERLPVVTQRGGEVAVLEDSWKGVSKGGGWRFHDLASDPQELEPTEAPDPGRFEARLQAFEQTIPMGEANEISGSVGICGTLRGKEREAQLDALRELGYVE